MKIEADLMVNASAPDVWKVVTDIENSVNTISGVEEIEMLERPETGLSGLKWRETRSMFGKISTEEMWITDVVEGGSFVVEAESNGSKYRKEVTLEDLQGQTKLRITFGATPANFLVGLLCLPFLFLVKGTMRRMLMQDLFDLKNAAE